MMSTTEEDQKMPTVVDVWVQLAYREGQNNDVELGGNAFPIDSSPVDVARLIEAVKNKIRKLKDIDVDEMYVYRLKEGVALPSEEDAILSLNNCEKLDVDEGVSQIPTSATTKKEKPGPLIVVAPKPFIKYVAPTAQPAAAAASKELSNDITVSWEANQSSAVLNLPNTETRLRNFIVSLPTERAPIDASILSAWKRIVPENVLDRFFVRVSSGDCCRELGQILSNLLFHPAIIPGANEDSFHGRVDQCLLSFLARFSEGLELRRNTSQDASSTLLERPDVIACVSGKGCYFRGEEKRIGSNEDPKSELYLKLQNVWPFPGLPYVLGYYSVGPIVTFSKVSVGSAVEIAHPLNLSNPTARLWCWNAARNIARLLNFMIVAPGPSRIPMDMTDIKHEGGVGLDWTRTVKFSGGHVVKECVADTAERIQKQQRVESVISVIQQGVDGVQTIIRHKKSGPKRQRSGMFYMETLLGETITRVEDTKQLRCLVEELLRIVRSLHNKGVTHRDIRLPNIVKSIVDGTFALIDWDDSVLGIENLDNSEVAHLDPTSHAPEIFVPGGTHSSSVDLWSIGFLIKSCEEHADAQLKALMNGLLAPATDRLSDGGACAFLGVAEVLT